MRCGGGGLKRRDQRRVEHERRQPELDNLARLRGEETRLQKNPRGDSGAAQLARLVDRRDSEIAASFGAQRARDRHRAVPVAVRLDHHHQLAVRGDRTQRVVVRAQRAEIDLRDSWALFLGVHRYRLHTKSIGDKVSGRAGIAEITFAVKADSDNHPPNGQSMKRPRCLWIQPRRAVDGFSPRRAML